MPIDIRYGLNERGMSVKVPGTDFDQELVHGLESKLVTTRNISVRRVYNCPSDFSGKEPH